MQTWALVRLTGSLCLVLAYWNAAGQTSAAQGNRPAGNWPCFRGPTGDGVSAEKNLPLEWTDTKNIVWKTQLPGAGASSPITWGDRIYLTCWSNYGVPGKPRGKLEELKKHLLCLNRADGRIVWNKSITIEFVEHPFGDYVNRHGYASSTPAVDATGIYCFFGVWGAHAFNHDGSQKWEHSCGTGYTNYGSAASPLLVGDLVVVNAGQEDKSMVALDKATGRQSWRFPVIGFGAYSTPILVKGGTGDELVFPLGGDWDMEKNRAVPSGLAAVDPRTKRSLWQCICIDVNLHASPVAADGIVYGLANRACAVRTGGKGDVTSSHLLWEVNEGCEVGSPVFHQGHLYWADQDGICHCLDVKDDRVVYKERLQPTPGAVYASGIVGDGKIYYVSPEKGTYVIAAQPSFKLLAHK